MPTALAAILLVACAASLEPAQNAALDTATIVPTTPSLGTFALVEEARKQSIPFAGHLPFGIRAFEASDAGRAPIEHLTGIAIACSSANKTL